MNSFKGIDHFDQTGENTLLTLLKMQLAESWEMEFTNLDLMQALHQLVVEVGKCVP